jgi:hypothetical protein
MVPPWLPHPGSSKGEPEGEDNSKTPKTTWMVIPKTIRRATPSPTTRPTSRGGFHLARRMSFPHASNREERSETCRTTNRGRIPLGAGAPKDKPGEGPAKPRDRETSLTTICRQALRALRATARNHRANRRTRSNCLGRRPAARNAKRRQGGSGALPRGLLLEGAGGSPRRSPADHAGSNPGHGARAQRITPVRTKVAAQELNVVHESARFAFCRSVPRNSRLLRDFMRLARRVAVPARGHLRPLSIGGDGFCRRRQALLRRTQSVSMLPLRRTIYGLQRSPGERRIRILRAVPQAAVEGKQCRQEWPEGRGELCSRPFDCSQGSLPVA